MPQLNTTDLTIAVCSNRIDKLIKYTLPLFKELQYLYSVKIFLDQSIEGDLNCLYNKIGGLEQIEIISQTNTHGHSNLRNLVLKSCITKYLLFIDDDISITNESVKSILKELQNKTEIVGLTLVPADHIYLNKWYISINQFHYLAIHNKSTLNTIWGACMAFDMEPIKHFNVSFNNKLGRNNKNFLSGEDTSFISNLIKNGCKSKILQSHVAIHYIEDSRIRFWSLLRRVYWQGITESMRQNIRAAFRKELARNFSEISIHKFSLGFFWMLVFICGCFYGMFYRKYHH